MKTWFIAFKYYSGGNIKEGYTFLHAEDSQQIPDKVAELAQKYSTLTLTSFQVTKINQI